MTLWGVSWITISIYLMVWPAQLFLFLHLPIMAFSIFLEASVGFQICDPPRAMWVTRVTPWPPPGVVPWSCPPGWGFPKGLRHLWLLDASPGFSIEVSLLLWPLQDGAWGRVACVGLGAVVSRQG